MSSFLGSLISGYLDFKAAINDNYGPKCPIKYSDLEPHYSAIEKLLHTKGNYDGLEQIPDGIYSEAMPLTESENIFKERIENKLNYKLIHSRGFGPSNNEGWPESSSPGSTLKKALMTGKVEVLANHIAEKFIFVGSSLLVCCFICSI